MKTILNINNINKSYLSKSKNNIVALSDVTIGFYKNEIIAIVGPNGAGKSTLFKIILGLISADSGSIQFINNGNEIGQSNNRSIGYLSEKPQYPLNFSVHEILVFCGKLSKMTESEIKLSVSNVLNVLSLEAYKNNKIKELSKGLLVRVGIGQAIMNNPEILILDEPTEGLDPLSRIKLKNILKEFRNKNKTVIMATHNLQEVEVLADRFCFLVNGKIKEIINRDELAKASLSLEELYVKIISRES